jgi:hypothetical protein
MYDLLRKLGGDDVAEVVAAVREDPTLFPAPFEAMFVAARTFDLRLANRERANRRPGRSSHTRLPSRSS